MNLCKCNITDKLHRSMTIYQRQELTVVILCEFVARQMTTQLVRMASPAPIRNTVLDELHYVGTQPGDL